MLDWFVLCAQNLHKEPELRMANTAISQRQGLPAGTFRGVLAGGFIAGVLDILWAFLNTWLLTGYEPPVVLKAVASGLLGTHAFFRGTGTALLGLVLHFFIAFSWAGLFAAVAVWGGRLGRGIPSLPDPSLVDTSLVDTSLADTLLAGALWGVVVYGVMTWVVLPLSAVPRLMLHHSLEQMALELGEHILFIGFSIALSLRYSLMRASHG
jgi:hypothetical protein